MQLSINPFLLLCNLKQYTSVLKELFATYNSMRYARFVYDLVKKNMKFCVQQLFSDKKEYMKIDPYNNPLEEFFCISHTSQDFSDYLQNHLIAYAQLCTLTKCYVSKYYKRKAESMRLDFVRVYRLRELVSNDSIKRDFFLPLMSLY